MTTPEMEILQMEYEQKLKKVIAEKDDLYWRLSQIDKILTAVDQANEGRGGLIDELMADPNSWLAKINNLTWEGIHEKAEPEN